MHGGPDPGALLGGLLCILIVAIPIGLAIGAIILRAACWLYNKIVGGPLAPSAVPEPGFGWAMLITFVGAVINNILSFIIAFALVAGAGPSAADRQLMTSLAQLISLPISFLITAGILTGMLPTTFPRALAVTALQFLVILVVIIVLAMIAGVIVGLVALTR